MWDIMKGLETSGGVRHFVESEQKIYRKLTCDIIYKQS